MMDIEFAKQLVIARINAECSSSYESGNDKSEKSTEDLKYFAELAGVHITFTDCRELSRQCAKARMKHELALLEEESNKRKLLRKGGKPKTPLKVAVKNVHFGLGCC